MKLGSMFEDLLPIRRKRTTDWVIPALAGLGVGIAAGIGVGVLLAPESGEEMRYRLREGAHRMKARAGELAQRTKSQVASTAERAHERSS